MIIECFQPQPAEKVLPPWSTTAVTASICGLTAGNEWQSTDFIYKYTISYLKFIPGAETWAIPSLLLMSVLACNSGLSLKRKR